MLPLVKLDTFEGPFDLLIELARAHKIDLSRISLSRITDSFLTYVQETPLPPAVLADFLVVASTLLLLKVHQLLPELTHDGEEELAELTDRVRVYELYRTQALALRERWGQRLLLPGPERLAVAAPVAFPRIMPNELAHTFHAVVTRLRPPVAPQRHLRTRYRSLQECMALLSARVTQYRSLVFQRELAGEAPQVAAVSFLALLEMARVQQVQLHQEQPFGTLHVNIVS